MNTSIVKLINKALDKYLPSGKTPPRRLHAAMRYSVFSGGKRIRPAVVIESARACAAPSLSGGGGRTKGVILAACAVELIHAYSLIHDDLPAMDDDDYRRGRPSCHRKFGEACAILAGDALLTLAFNLLARGRDKIAAVRAIECLSEASGPAGMVGGQAADLGMTAKNMDKKALKRVNRLKTAKLFEASAKIGAIISRAGRGKELTMARYGASLGLLFQLTDDIIDKDGYAKRFGGESSFKAAVKASKEAKAALKIFGREADTLRNIADEILKRSA